MNRRTFDIIMACKADTEGHFTKLDNVIEFLSKECGTPKEHYTIEEMDKIMFEAVCDYIDTCDRPSTFLRNIMNVIGGDNMCSAERICRAFTMVRIKNGTNYVNGFKSEFFEDETSKSKLEEFSEMLNEAYNVHLSKGCPEADDDLNGTNLQVLKEYIALYPNAMLVKLNDAVPVIPAKNAKLHNFCCELVYNADADAEKIEHLKEMINSYKKSPNLEDVSCIWESINTVEGLSFLWS